MKNTIILLGLLFFSISLQAQVKDSPKNMGEVDLSLAYNTNATTIALAWNRMHAVALKKKFLLGYGLRFTSYFGKNNNFVTAPASVSEGNFFKKQNEAKLDTFILPKSQINSLNIAINLGYQFNKKLFAGFNIDAIGLSFGAPQTGTYCAHSQGGVARYVDSKPTSYNVLLTGDYDIGSLNSELFVKYALNDKISLRGGFSFMFSEVTTDVKLDFDNDRFRKKNLMGMLAVSYRL